ncbi:MAG: DNA polymerase III subunit beta [Candidatus Liptonbacteria bacterium CG11_big_fil_rev_8_21_14_0_20_35_14]|uniref:Beta sliding clamp n=1 Tax=Candidatus Liptonbacteria bacterium CG11_big_fil_rev_8_21_14_0_20_35_14 TaxID=1974634 RepID=A0A2H0N7X8_9BACT|nr:MAG: DNA polymerase III subunit beta [Candidatus Liptonbacteria bacterium CG11_big_fil_rev_8_21_14_0_20_35_14]
MKIIIVKNNIKKAIDAVVKISSFNSHLPILKNIFIKTDGNKLIFTTTDLEVAIRYFSPAKIIEPGEFTVSALIFNSIINNLNSDVINLELKGDILHLQSDNYKAELNTLSPDDFPIIPSLKKGSEIGVLTINSNILKEYLNQILLATTFYSIRPEINGIYFKYNGSDLYLVGTDSFRLGEKYINSKDFTTNLESEVDFIIPLKIINEFLHIVSPNTSVLILFDNNQISFQTDDFIIISRLIDGKFPDYKQIIPKDSVSTIVCDKSELINGLKVTSVLSSKVFDVTISLNSNHFKIYSNNQGIGENNYLIPAKISGENIEVKFNINYLLNGIKSIIGEKVVLKLNINNKPTIIQSENDSSYTYILLPIKG